MKMFVSAIIGLAIAIALFYGVKLESSALILLAAVGGAAWGSSVGFMDRMREITACCGSRA